MRNIKILNKTFNFSFDEYPSGISRLSYISSTLCRKSFKYFQKCYLMKYRKFGPKVYQTWVSCSYVGSIPFQYLVSSAHMQLTQSKIWNHKGWLLVQTKIWDVVDCLKTLLPIQVGILYHLQICQKCPFKGGPQIIACYNC